MNPEVVILEGARTPMVGYGGAFSDVSAIELGATAARGAIERSGVSASDIEHAVVGNAQQTSADALYGARHVALRAGVPVEVPALTVNRICGSGIQAIVTAAQLVRLGEARCVLAGGMENMTQAPHVVRGARRGFRLGEGKLEDSLMAALLDTFCGFTMAGTAENVAKKYGIGREDSDRYALRSQEAAEAARAAGKLAEEIVPVTAPGRKGPVEVRADDHPRPETTLEILARLPPAFQKDGIVTAGNASGIVDGAAAVVVADAAWARERGRRPLGKIVSWGIAGVEPSLMGIGPVPATQKALAAAGLTLADVDLFEVNEAFAAQYLAVERALELDRGKANVNGGAIALGHPLGATGTRIAYSLLRELRRRGGRIGVATACIGGGQGIAIVLEAAGERA